MKRPWWTGVVGGAIAAPLSILLHELGHWGAFLAFRLPDPTLSFASVGWTGAGDFKRLWRAGEVEAAAAIAEPWHVAVGFAAGPIVTYLMVITCVLAVRRYGPGPLSLLLGLGLAACLRWLIAVPILLSNLRGDTNTSNTDEGWIAALSGISENIPFSVGLACLVLGCWFLVAAIPREDRVRVLLPTLGGMVLGGLLWIQWLGPLVLP